MSRSQLKRHREHFARRTAAIRRATTQSLSKETEEEQAARVRSLLEPARYVDFFQYYFGVDSTLPISTARCATFHVDAYKKLLSHTHIVQFRLWFRGSAKSIQSNVGNPFALKCMNELKFMLLVGITETRARLLLSDLQAQLESNERIIKDFGKQVKYGDWSEGAFETQDGCYFLARGINQPIRGLRKNAFRLDYVVIDDVEDRKIALNTRLVQERADKVLGDIGGAFSKDKQRMVICNNYITKQGVVNRLLAAYQGKRHVDISRVNLTHEDLTPTWPAYYSTDDVQRIIKRFDEHTLKREYYNEPIEVGKVFKHEWIVFERVEEEKSPDVLVGYWDLSYKKEGDYKAFALVGVCGARYVVFDIFCRKCELSQAVAWHYQVVRSIQKKGWSPLYYYDATASQEVVFQPLFEQEAKKHHIIDYPLPHREHAVDKYIRVEATLTSIFFNRQLVFSESIRSLPDTQIAVDQLLAFEKGSKAHDDFPDALETAVRLCQKHHMALSACYDEQLIFKKKGKGGY